MEFVSYGLRVIFMLLVAWLGARVIGKRSVADMTSYDLVGILLLSTVAAQPLVFKITSKAAIGTLIIAGGVAAIGLISLLKPMYNFDTHPLLLIADGKINMRNLRTVRMNIPLLLSHLRNKGYQNVSDIQLAIMEPMGKLSVIPKPSSRPVQTSDLNIATSREGLGLPIVVDGRILVDNLRWANLDMQWLNTKLEELKVSASDLVLLEMDAKGRIFAQTRDTRVISSDVFEQET